MTDDTVTIFPSKKVPWCVRRGMLVWSLLEILEVCFLTNNCPVYSVICKQTLAPKCLRWGAGAAAAKVRVAKWWAHRTSCWVQCKNLITLDSKNLVWRIWIGGSSLTSGFQGLIILGELRLNWHFLIFSQSVFLVFCVAVASERRPHQLESMNLQRRRMVIPLGFCVYQQHPRPEYVAAWNQHMTYAVHRMLDWRETYLQFCGIVWRDSCLPTQAANSALRHTSSKCMAQEPCIFLLVKKAKNKKGKINDEHEALKPTDRFNYITHSRKTAPPSSSGPRTGWPFFCMFHIVPSLLHFLLRIQWILMNSAG